MFKNILADSGLLTTTDEILTTITPTRGTQTISFTTVKINIEPSTASTQGIMETKTSATSVDTTLTMLTSAIPLVTTSASIAPVTAIPNIDPSYSTTSIATDSSFEITSSSTLMVTQMPSVISPSTGFDDSTLIVTSTGEISTSFLTGDRLLMQTGSKDMMLATISSNISPTCKSGDYIQFPYKCFHFV